MNTCTYQFYRCSTGNVAVVKYHVIKTVQISTNKGLKHKVGKKEKL